MSILQKALQTNFHFDNPQNQQDYSESSSSNDEFDFNEMDDFSVNFKINQKNNKNELNLT